MELHSVISKKRCNNTALTYQKTMHPRCAHIKKTMQLTGRHIKHDSNYTASYQKTRQYTGHINKRCKDTRHIKKRCNCTAPYQQTIHLQRVRSKNDAITPRHIKKRCNYARHIKKRCITAHHI
jgi:hypothetical protein